MYMLNNFRFNIWHTRTWKYILWLKPFLFGKLLKPYSQWPLDTRYKKFHHIFKIFGFVGYQHESKNLTVIYTKTAVIKYIT